MSDTQGTSPQQKNYDLVVIGSGPAGQRAAIQAAKLKKKVLVIERDAAGGACLNLGTIPSKTLREAALSPTTRPENALESVMAQKERVIWEENSVIHQQLSRNNVEFITGVASFTSPHGIKITTPSGSSEVEGAYILIAVGTHPIRPRQIPFDDECLFDSDTILRMKTLPKTLAVIGAGVIGSEYASIFARLGVQVTIVDRRTTLFRAVDNDVLHALTHHFSTHGVKLMLGADFEAIHVREGKGKRWVEFMVGTEKIVADAAMYCMGREGNVKDLNLSAARLNADERGILKVNEHYQTHIPHIYAAGDVIGAPALAASSGEQGRLAAAHAFGIAGGKFPETFPYGIYTIPEISSVGAQEADLIKSNIPFVAGRALYKELARGKILGDETGFLKLLIHKETHKILGIHIIGTGATELIHIGQACMALGGSFEFLVDNVFNYPTLAEAYKVAAFHALNQLRGHPTQR